MAESVYQRALGERFAELDPSLRAYCGAPPDGSVGVGRGTFDIAGSRYRWLRPVLAWLSWRRVLFPEFAEDVPFTIVNRPDSPGTLSAQRVIEFARRRVIEDTMSAPSPGSGFIIDRLGRRRGLEAELRVAVAEGRLRMRSTRLALHLGPIRIPIPALATVHLDEGPDPTDPTRQRVDLRITAPVLGEVFRYAGSFSYEYRAVRGA